MKLKEYLLDLTELNEAVIYDAETGNFSHTIQYHTTPQTDAERLQNWLCENVGIVAMDEDGVNVGISQLVRDNYDAFDSTLDIDSEYDAVNLLEFMMEGNFPNLTRVLLEKLK